MRELTKCEAYQALENAKSTEESAGREILENFELEQTALAQTIFAPLPSQKDIGWLEKQVLLLDTELKSLSTKVPMDKKIRENLQDQFVKRARQGRPTPA